VVFQGFYRRLLAEERRHRGWKVGIEASTRNAFIDDRRKRMEYEEFMFSA
jgi:hypothetical protein